MNATELKWLGAGRVGGSGRKSDPCYRDFTVPAKPAAWPIYDSGELAGCQNVHFMVQPAKQS